MLNNNNVLLALVIFNKVKWEMGCIGFKLFHVLI